MYQNQLKIFASISLLLIALLLFLPVFITISVSVCATAFIGGNYLKNNYEIDYKYGLSFLGQLLGLILIVASIIAIFTLAASLINL